MKQIFLICNAHLDPVWQWEWEEGLAETLSTFRIAADFCEEFDGFVFNHNESLLYQWVEEYEPELFAKIQNLVKQGRWHIMGGWYLQPDCNMPSGESLVRQIATGRKYFKEKFNRVPTTAINFDSFGHSRGLVQILKKAGYDSYIVGRPAAFMFDPPAVDFNWIGYDGSEIATHLSDELYNSSLGKATEKIENYRNGHQEANALLILWGIGNHGGGPSRIDLEQIAQLKEKLKKQNYLLIHSTPEEYFDALPIQELPKFEKSLNSVMIGCYTSQILIKQKHRVLENILYSTEKMVCGAELQTGYIGNWDRIKEAEKALLFSEFHDVLPGSSVKRAEEASLRNMDYAMELLSKERMRAFMSFAALEAKETAGNIPVFIYNASPYPVQRVVECEFQLQDQNRSGTYTDFEVYQDGKKIPSQLEKEDSNIPIDWRKRIVFDVNLAPFAVTAVRCKPVILPSKPSLFQPDGDRIQLSDGSVSVSVGTDNGLIKEYIVDGVSMLSENTGELLVIRDDEDPWGMTKSSYRSVIGSFALADPARAGKIAGLQTPLAPVRIIEQGEVRTVAEAIFTYEQSAAIVRYCFENASKRLQVKIKLQWMQPDKMIKLSLKSALSQAECYGQTIFGREKTIPDGRESVFQKWLTVADAQHAVSVINTGIYAHDYCDNELRMTLLHSPAYCAHPINDLQILPNDRYMPRIDIGERSFDFVIRAGEKDDLLANIDREAQIENESPFALSYYPSGKGGTAGGGMHLNNSSIILSAFTKEKNGYLIRLFNPLPQQEPAHLTFPAAKAKADLLFQPFEIKTLLLKDGIFREVLLDGSDKE